VKQTKFVFLATAVIAILIVFAVNYISAGPIGLTLWQMTKLSDMQGHIFHGYIILGAMVLPLLFGGLALKSQRLPRWQAIVSVLAYAIALFLAFAVFRRAGGSFGKDGAIGAKLMVVALGAGLVAALAGAVKPERA
jgi:hypothetical protein